MSPPRPLKTSVVVSAALCAALVGWLAAHPATSRAKTRPEPAERRERSAPRERPERTDAMAFTPPSAQPTRPAPSEPSTAKSPSPGPSTNASAAKVASAGSAKVASAPPTRAALVRAPTSASPGTIVRRIDVDLSKGPLYFTGAFDGSKRFGMWADTTRFAREFERRHKKAVHFTYFINTCYYDPTTEGSAIGRAESAGEALVRRALTQQAINEGHEIASHAVRHKDGSAWTAEEWRRELTEFQSVVESSLFEPIRDDDGAPVFPRFQAAPGAAPREVGAACSSSADCASGACLELTKEQSFCTDACNAAKPCPRGTACGAPDYTEDTDVCVPIPEYPVYYLGAELFDAEGRPNRARPELVPYSVKGFRAPYLGVNDAMLSVLLDLGYVYDASQVQDPGPPLRIALRGAPERSMFEMALSQQAGSRAVPMDFNYLEAGADGERMKADYRRSLILAYGPGKRSPWNVGHHFALWRGGEYWRAMQDAFTFAGGGCPSERGEKLCPDVEFPSLRELAARLADSERRAADDRGAPRSPERGWSPIRQVASSVASETGVETDGEPARRGDGKGP